MISFWALPICRWIKKMDKNIVLVSRYVKMPLVTLHSLSFTKKRDQS